MSTRPVETASFVPPAAFGQDETDLGIIAPLLRRISLASLHTDGKKLGSRSFGDLPREMQEKLIRMLRQILRVETIHTHLQNRSGQLQFGLKRKENDEIVLALDHHTVEVQGKDARELFDHLLDHAHPEKKQPVEEMRMDLAIEKEKEYLEGLQMPLLDKAMYYAFPEILSLSIDGGSIARNTLSVADPLSGTVTALGFFGGAASFVCGGIIAAKGAQQVKAADAIDDLEGSRMGWLNVAAGVSYAGVGAGMILDKVGVVKDLPGLSIAGGAGVIDPLSLTMYAALLVQGTYEAQIAGAFRNGFNGSLSNGGIAGGVAFLHEQLALSSDELAEVNRIKDPIRREAEIKRRLQVKCNAFARRTDGDTLRATLASIQRLNKAFTEGKVDIGALKEAHGLIEKVSKANFKRIIKATMLILIALGGLAATVASMVLTGGVPCILFASMAGAWIFLDKSGLADKVGDLSWWIHRHGLGKDKLFEEELKRYREASAKKLGIDIDREVAASFGMSVEAMESTISPLQRLARQQKLFGPQGTYIEQDLARTLNIAPEQAAVFGECCKQGRTDAEAIQNYIGTKEAYQQLYQASKRDISAMQFTHLSRDRTFFALPRKAEALIAYVSTKIKNFECDAKRLQQLLNSGAPLWTALLESTEKLYYSGKRRVLVTKALFDVADEIRGARCNRIAEIPQKMPRLYGLLTQKSKDVDLSILLQRVDPERREWSEGAIKSACLGLLLTLREDLIAVDNAFSHLTSQGLAALDAYCATDMVEPPRPDLVPSLLRLATAFSEDDREIPAEFAHLLLSPQEERLVHCKEAILERAQQLYPAFLRDYLRHPTAPSHPIQEDIDYFSKKRETVKIEGRSYTMPWQATKDYNRAVATVLEVEGEQHPFFRIEGDVTGAEKGGQIVQAIDRFAAGDPALFQTLCLMNSQVPKNYGCFFFQELIERGLTSGDYPYLLNLAGVKKQQFVKKRDGSIECTYLYGANLVSSQGVKVPVPFRVVYRMVKKDDSWIVLDPKLIPQPL